MKCPNRIPFLILSIAGLVVSLLTNGNLQAQTTTTIDYETANDGYTPSATSGSGRTDTFNRTDTATGNNDGFYFAAEDIPGNRTITLDPIDISGASSFDFSIDFLTPNTNDWDSSDELLIT